MHSLKAGSAASSKSSLPRRAEEEEEEEELTEDEKAMKELRSRQWEERRWRAGINLDGDVLDNLQEWYEEGLLGPGGMPKRKGQQAFVGDLILRSFFGKWRDNGLFIRSKNYTGTDRQPSLTDFQKAYETLKTNAKEGLRLVGRDDGNGWTWLVAGQNPGGLFLYLTREVPFGERPLALIKNSDPDEFFDKADWNRVFIRLHRPQLWGGPVRRFPYPMGKVATQKWRKEQIVEQRMRKI